MDNNFNNADYNNTNFDTTEQSSVNGGCNYEGEVDVHTKTNEVQKKNNRIFLIVTSVLCVFTLIICSLLIFFTIGNKTPTDKEKGSMFDSFKKELSGENDDEELLKEYIQKGEALIASNGATYYAPDFLIDGSYVYEVESEISSDLANLKQADGSLSSDATFKYEAFINGDILSVKFESGLSGDMKNRYYNIDVTTGERATIVDMQYQSGISESQFHNNLINVQTNELKRIYEENGWGDIYSNSYYCTECWNTYSSEAHMLNGRFYMDGDGKIHVVNYFPGSTTDSHVLKDLVCE